MPPGKQRRALSAPGGPVTAGGDSDEAARLAAALPATGETEAQSLTHGFHGYAARFHPLMVRRLLEGSEKGQSLLDPFVGSGTTLVEGVTFGLRCYGVDANPLAVMLSLLKATPRPFERRMPLLDAAKGVAERSLGRVEELRRTRTTGAEYDDPARYAPHVFRELVGLREEIDAERDRKLHEPLALILSSIVLKVSRRTSRTSGAAVERSIGKGLPTRLFLRRAEELIQRMADLAAHVPAATATPDVRLGDARKLAHLKDHAIDLVITSPPYLGTYDYDQQQTPHYGWLRIDASARKHAATHEIGARRPAAPPATTIPDAASPLARTAAAPSSDRNPRASQSSRNAPSQSGRSAPPSQSGRSAPPQSGRNAPPSQSGQEIAEFQRDTAAFIGELARVLAPGGRIYIASGDSFVGVRAIPGDQAIRAAAEKHHLEVAAWAAQARPSFYAPAAARSRREHLLLLRRR